MLANTSNRSCLPIPHRTLSVTHIIADHDATLESLCNNGDGTRRRIHSYSSRTICQIREAQRHITLPLSSSYNGALHEEEIAKVASASREGETPPDGLHRSTRAAYEVFGMCMRRSQIMWTDDLGSWVRVTLPVLWASLRIRLDIVWACTRMRFAPSNKP